MKNGFFIGAHVMRRRYCNQLSLLVLSVFLGFTATLAEASLLALELEKKEFHLKMLNPSTQQLLKNLEKIGRSSQFIFGQQRANLTGIGENGRNWWGDGNFGRESDVKRLTGKEVGLIGIDVWDLAIKNSKWNQGAYSQAIRQFYSSGQGGVITLDWHMRGCDIQEEKGAYGEYSIPGHGFQINDWWNDSNRSCLCRIVNEVSWYGSKTWKNWLYEQKLDRLANKMRAEGLAEIPIIIRPFHEHNGNWFWWGQKSWDCQRHLGRNDVVSGPEAYRRLFRMTVDYLRDHKGFNNLLVAYSTDKLCRHEGHSCDNERAMQDRATDEEYRLDYMFAYPGDEYVDIMGIDLYFAADHGQHWQSLEYQAQVYSGYVKAVSVLAKSRGKIAAITETGNSNLYQEVDSGSRWFSEHLLQQTIINSGADIAYVMAWENRTTDRGNYFIPHRQHAGVYDFLRFADNKATLFLPDISEIYQVDTKQVGDQEAPYCQSGKSDDTGDGWGWENNQSCRVKVEDRFPSCNSIKGTDNGWGWESGRVCKVREESYPYCQYPDQHNPGDSWGWEDEQSCRLR